ncbi:MAG: polysaccharide pyruvyl transferase family protein [Candidatus Peribacteraceae bacterium]|nr:polysaccharide pyruvyl transferase family protein [Candidatus Peribacteraceae bacterium]
MQTLQNERESICILPGRPGNMGDVRVLCTCVQAFKKEKLLFITYEHGLWDVLVPDVESISLFGRKRRTKDHHLGGCGKLLRFIDSLFRLLWNFPSVYGVLRRSKQFILLGMDNLDGHYDVLPVLHELLLARMAFWSGARVDLVNCSFNDHPSRIAVFALRHLPSGIRIVAREPVSHARMTKFLSRPIVLAADVSFLFAPDVHTQNSLQSSIDWLRRQKNRGQRVIGLNIADIPDVPIERLVDMCVQTIERMPQASFLLIPHVKYGPKYMPDEERLLRRIISGVSPEARKRCSILPFPYDLSDFQQVLCQLDCALTGRMHLAIGLLSADRPVCCITYQNKFEGLFIDYLRMSELLLDLNAAIADGNFVRPLTAMLSSQNEISQRITEALPMLRQLAARNFL